MKVSDQIRILVVEDREEDAALAAHELRKGGVAFTSLRVETRGDFLRALSEFAPDIILSDYNLPQFNGLEALRLLKESSLDAPFILITGSMTEEVAVDCMKQGVNDYVLKTSLKRLPSAVLNVLERVRAERARAAALDALRESEERYRVFVANSSEGIWRFELERPLDVTLPADEQVEHIYRHAYLAECNDAMAQMYGCSRAAEVVGLRAEELLTRSNTHNAEHLRAFVRAGYRLVEAELSEVIGGEERHFLLNRVGVVKGGRLLRIWGTRLDVTARKRAEAERDAERRLLNAVVHQLPVGVAFVDEGMRFTRVNPQIGSIFDTEPARLVGMSLSEAVELFGATTADGTPLRHGDLASRRALSTGRATDPQERLITTPSGEKRRVLVSAAPVTLERGEPSGSVLVFTDVTEQYAVQEQLRQSQRIESIGMLAGGVAHDMNNLLTVINGYSELLLKQVRDDESLRAKVEEIKKAGARASELTHQLLAFGRKQLLQPRVLDLNEVITDMDRMLRRLIGEDIDLKTVTDPALGRVKADFGQIQQVVMNLAVNARDAMPRGGKLTIETGNVYLDDAYAARHISVRPGRYVRLAVSDTGRGMDAETRMRVFEPFFTTKERGKGTGLGLSTVYGIVKQSEGYIWGYSEVGLGTTFKVYLPLVEGAVEAPRAAAVCAGRGGTETLLLVEDEASVRAFMSDALEAGGYKLLVAGDGEEALNLARTHDGPIHLLITDVVMPRMGGATLARHLAPRRPETRVLYISGYTDDALAHRGVIGPDVAFLEKPLTPDSLLRSVRDVLDAPPGRTGFPAGASKRDSPAPGLRVA